MAVARSFSGGVVIRDQHHSMSCARHINNKAMVHCRLRPRHPLHNGLVCLAARSRLGHDATSTTQQGRYPAHDDALTSLAATVSTCLHTDRYVRYYL